MIDLVLRIALVVLGVLLMAPAADAQVFRPRSKNGVPHAAKKITPPGASVVTIPTTTANPMAPTKSPVKATSTVTATKTAAKKTTPKKRVVKKSGDDDEEVVVVDDDDDE